ncbi:MAG: response regulator, partial [Paracoccaceae bacterium]
DLVLMDISMPVMDGIEATRRIRAESASRNAVILGVTAMLRDDTDAEARAAGMQAVLVKPVTGTQLGAAIRREWMAQPAVPDAAPAMEASVVFRCEELAELVGEDTAQALVRETIADARRACIALRTGAADPAERVAIVHRAVGSAAVVGLSGLHEALAAAERDCAEAGAAECEAHALAVSSALDSALAQLTAPCEAA